MNKRPYWIVPMLALCVSCRPLPASVPEESSSDHVRASPPVARLAPELAPDAAALQHSLDAAIGFPVEVSAHVTVVDESAAVRTFVAFVAWGADVCPVLFGPERLHECVYDEESPWLPWEALHYIGFAVVESEGDSSLRVRRFRVMDGSGPLHFGGSPFSEALGSTWDKWPRPETSYAYVEIETFSVADVDEDGRVEIVVYFSYSDVAPVWEIEREEESDPLGARTVMYPFDEQRLIILREDLSLQFDTGLYYRRVEWNPEGNFIDDDALDVHYVIDRDQVVVHWCIVSPLVTAHNPECPLEILCDHPTHRVIIPYDRATDRYGKPQVERLRPEVTGFGCP